MVANKPLSDSYLAWVAIAAARHCGFPCHVIARSAVAPRLILLIFVVIFASVLLDMLQMIGRRETARSAFTQPLIPIEPLDFSPTQNHNAAFLYSAIPFVTAWTIGLVRDHRRNRAIGLALLALL